MEIFHDEDQGPYLAPPGNYSPLACAAIRIR